MTRAWQQYVVSLCTQAWDLRPTATAEVLTKIEALAETGMLTEAAVALVLSRAGVKWSDADAIASSIRLAVLPASVASASGRHIRRQAASNPRPFWHPRAAGRLSPVP
jgi:hypothetical protein